VVRTTISAAVPAADCLIPERIHVHRGSVQPRPSPFPLIIPFFVILLLKASTAHSRMEQQRTDILISIKPVHIENIASRLKTHEFRKYLIPRSVRRMWFYTSAPIQELRYVAVISNGKTAEEIGECAGGLGVSEFKSGLKESQYGYEILELYHVQEPFSLKEMKERGWINGPPRKYQWVSKNMLDTVPLEGLRKVF
jgi:hypothetical protein